MNKLPPSRRQFLKLAGISGAGLLAPAKSFLADAIVPGAQPQAPESPADYTLRIANTPIEIAPNRIVSAITYNGQFPGRCCVSRKASKWSVDIHNDTDTPEQLHWHGQFVSTDVDGARKRARRSSPRTACAASSSRLAPRASASITRTIAPAPIFTRGNTAARSGRSTSSPKANREITIAKSSSCSRNSSPSLSQGGDMDMDFLAPATGQGIESFRRIRHESFARQGHAARLRSRLPVFHDQWAHAGHGEPVRVKQGERVLFHVLNGSATEIRSLALPGHTFQVVALDGNPVPNAGRSSRALARNGGTNFRHRRNESSGRVGYGRSCGR